MKRKVLLTGASGNIGAKLITHFRSTDAYDLTLVDIVGGGDIVAADLSVWDDEWPKLFEGVDTVLHFAGEPRGTSSWAMVTPANIVAVQHVLRAARAAKVRRVVHASTNQVMLGYRFREDIVTTDMPPMPLIPYGVSKLMDEQFGRAFTEETGISFLALRIGYFQRGENRPGPHMDIGVWGQQMWLSNRDMMHAAERAIEAEGVGYAVVNLVSDNPGMRWDLEHTRKTIGYAPKDGHATVITDKTQADDERARRATMVPGTWFDEHFTEVTG